MTEESVNNGVPFEELLKRLEGVVKQLEAGHLPLEESLRTYENGVSMVRLAQQRLEKMDGKIEQLMADGTTKELQD